jgi:hypothetical protein
MVVRLGFGMLAVALVAAACAGSSPERKISRYGISVRLPSGWQGAISLGRGPSGLPEVHVSKPPNVRILILEVGNRPGRNGFNQVRLPIRLQVKRTWRFAYGGRSFVVFAAVRPDAVTEANRVLSSFPIAAVSTPQIWASLRRPLHLPRVHTGQACPRARPVHVSVKVAFPIGGGPAYVGLGSSRGLADLDARELRRGRFFLHKTLWAISPTYDGPLLVRGRRLDFKGVLRFSLPGLTLDELHFTRAYLETAGWRYGPTTTAIPGPGCYAFQIDGRGFSEVLAFQARLIPAR